MVSSPCEDTEESCNLNENNICTTCCRTIKDIIDWRNMTEKERQERMNELREQYNNKSIK